MVTSPIAYRFKPSRMFARMFVQEQLPAPEPMTAASRGALSDKAFEDRLHRESTYVGDLYIPTPAQRECEDQVRKVIRNAEYGRPGAKSGLYVLGKPGVGKSTALLHAAATYHRKRLKSVGLDGDPDPRWSSDDSISDFVPVIFITWSSSAKNKAIVGQIAKFLGYGVSTATDTAAQMTEWASRHGVGLVVGDDSRNIADGGKSAESIHNLLKNLNTELGMLKAAWVYAGIPDDSGGGNLYANDQISQRFTPFVLKDFDLDVHVNGEETEANLAWSEYIAEWEQALKRVLPELEPGHLSSVVARRLWNRTNGSVGGITELLKTATLDVLEDRSNHRRLTLTRDRLAATPLPKRFEKYKF